MITTVTLNPALDKIYTIANFSVNKLYNIYDFSKLLSPGDINTASTVPGGKGINVALLTHKFGIKTTAMSIIGGNTGRIIEDLLIRDGLIVSFTYGSGNTRTNIAIIDNSNNTLTLINEPGDPILEEELDTFKKKYINFLEKSDIVALSGSIPQGTDPDYYYSLTDIAMNKRKIVILNSSKNTFEHSLEAGPTIAYPDLRANAKIFDMALESKQDFARLNERILSKHKNIQTVILSDLANSCIYFSTRDRLYEIIFNDLKPANFLGFADQVVSGLVYGIASNWDLLDSFKFAAASGLTNAESHAKLVYNLSSIRENLNRLNIKETKL